MVKKKLKVSPSFSKADDYVTVIRKGVPVKVCEEVVKEIKTRPWEKHIWYNSKTDSFTSEKTLESQMQTITSELTDKLHPFITKALTSYQDKYATYGGKCDNRWISSFTAPRFNKYTVGNKMRKHYDHIHSIFDGKRKGIPIISIVGTLNEGYKGARFMLRNKEIKLKTGDILLFPSVFIYDHLVTEPKKGTRYSFAAWAF